MRKSAQTDIFGVQALRSREEVAHGTLELFHRVLDKNLLRLNVIQSLEELACTYLIAWVDSQQARCRNDIESLSVGMLSSRDNSSLTHQIIVYQE